MADTEMSRAIYQALTDEPPICINCAYFTQHYLAANTERTQFVPCNLGHCSNTIARVKKTYSTCKNFRTKNAPSDAPNT